MLPSIATWLGMARDRRGVTAMEYGLIAALVAVVLVTALSQLGTDLAALFTGISGKLTAATPH